MAKPESLTELRKQWRKDPAFNAEYAALEDEFALAETFIKARAKLTAGKNEKRQ